MRSSGAGGGAKGLKLLRAARKSVAHCPLQSARGNAGARGLITQGRLLTAGGHSSGSAAFLPPGPRSLADPVTLASGQFYATVSLEDCGRSRL